MAKSSKPDTEQQWQTLMDAANDAYKAKQYKTAITQFSEALAIAEQFGPSDLRLATTINNLGLVYYTQKQYDKAEPLYTKALNIREAELGKHHALVAATMNNLGLLYYAQKQYTEAFSLGKETLEIRENLLGAEHLEVATSCNMLALVAHALGQDMEALAYCSRALAIREKHLKPNEALIASTRKTLAEIEKSLDKSKKAPEKGKPKTKKATTPIKVLPLVDLEDKPTRPPQHLPVEPDKSIAAKPEPRAARRMLAFAVQNLGEQEVRPERKIPRRGKRSWGFTCRNFNRGLN